MLYSRQKTLTLTSLLLLAGLLAASAGSWLNPWFVGVEQVPMTEIPIGYVGVVISFVGKAHIDVSGVDFKHGDLVNQGHKGVWVTPLYL